MCSVRGWKPSSAALSPTGAAAGRASVPGSPRSDGGRPPCHRRGPRRRGDTGSRGTPGGLAGLSTNQPAEQLSLAQAVLAYRNAYLVEQSLGRLKGRPLLLTPMYVQRDDHATGLMRLLSIALRVFVALWSLWAAVSSRRKGLNWRGFMPGNTKRDTARPTAERLLEAFWESTLTIVEGAQQTYRHLTALSPLRQHILEILGSFLSTVYKAWHRFCRTALKMGEP